MTRGIVGVAAQHCMGLFQAHRRNLRPRQILCLSRPRSLPSRQQLRQNHPHPSLRLRLKRSQWRSPNPHLCLNENQRQSLRAKLSLKQLRSPSRLQCLQLMTVMVTGSRL